MKFVVLVHAGERGGRWRRGAVREGKERGKLGLTQVLPTSALFIYYK